jgi:hypothetical protein
MLANVLHHANYVYNGSIRKKECLKQRQTVSLFTDSFIRGVDTFSVVCPKWRRSVAEPERRADNCSPQDIFADVLNLINNMMNSSFNRKREHFKHRRAFLFKKNHISDRINNQSTVQSGYIYVAAKVQQMMGSYKKICIFVNILNLIYKMINNSSIGKWDRLSQKQIDTQFINRLQAGMNCSMFEAKAILNCVYETYQPFFDNSLGLRPGQISFEVVSIDNSPGNALRDCQMKTVVLTLDAGEQDLRIRQQLGVTALRRHRLERICNEAFFFSSEALMMDNPFSKPS